MILISLLVVASYAIGFTTGLHFTRLHQKVAELARQLQELASRKQDAPQPPPKPTVFLADPDDLVQRSQFEREEALRELNKR